MLDDDSRFHVECLVPLSKIYTECPTAKLIIVHMVDLKIEQYQFAQIHDTETLGTACILPLWDVDCLCLWFDLFSQPAVCPAQWQLIQGQSKLERQL